MVFTTLVDAATLASHLDDPAWRIVDVRHQLADPQAGERAYREGHLPGARFLHCDRDLSGPRDGRNGRHPLPDPGMLAARLAAAGIGPGVQVVIYDDSQGMIAGRLWWLLRALGHRAVALLDGGLGAWLAAGGPLETVVRPVNPVLSWAPGTAWPAVDAATLLARLGRPGALIVDARSPDRFRGENETLDPVAGSKAIGFLTQDSLEELGMADHVTVYLPFSYSFAGQLLIFPRDRVTPLSAPSSKVMAFVVSGGVADVGAG